MIDDLIEEGEVDRLIAPAKGVIPILGSMRSCGRSRVYKGGRGLLSDSNRGTSAGAGTFRTPELFQDRRRRYRGPPPPEAECAHMLCILRNGRSVYIDLYSC
jgi:hypothetical protein